MVPPRHLAKLLLFGSALSILALAIGLIALQTTQQPQQHSTGITVAATLFPIADIAQNVGGNTITVIQLLPSGASPHSYALTPQQIARVQNAQAVFAIGHGLDTWVTQATTATAQIPIVNVDQGITLHGFGESHHEDDHATEEEAQDPHYWLTVPNAQQIATTITKTLQEIDPEHADIYEENRVRYNNELTTLEEELKTAAQRAPQKKFIAIHDAWSYFAQHYGFELVATYEPREGQQPTITDIRNLQRILQNNNITTFFTEPQKQMTGATHFIKEDLGLAIKVLDPIGGVGERNSYSNTMRYNMKTLTEQQ